MLQRTVEGFIHKAVTIGLGQTTVVAIRDHVKAFGIGIITRQRHARAVA